MLSAVLLIFFSQSSAADLMKLEQAYAQCFEATGKAIKMISKLPDGVRTRAGISAGTELDHENLLKEVKFMRKKSATEISSSFFPASARQIKKIEGHFGEEDTPSSFYEVCKYQACHRASFSGLESYYHAALSRSIEQIEKVVSSPAAAFDTAVLERVTRACHRAIAVAKGISERELAKENRIYRTLQGLKVRTVQPFDRKLRDIYMGLTIRKTRSTDVVKRRSGPITTGWEPKVTEAAK